MLQKNIILVLGVKGWNANKHKLEYLTKLLHVYLTKVNPQHWAKLSSTCSTNSFAHYMSSRVDSPFYPSSIHNARKISALTVQDCQVRKTNTKVP